MIRCATAEDAPAIAKVHIRSWQTAYRGQLPDSYLENLSFELPNRTEFWRAHIATPPANTEIWVASNDGTLTGFVALGPARGAASAATGEIYAIYVDPRFWSRAIGRAMFAHATERLGSLGFSDAILWVLESNQRARHFYEVAGWIPHGTPKTEILPGSIELQEVCYRKTLERPK